MTQPSKRNEQAPLDDALERYRDALKDLFPLPPPRPKSRKASKAAGVALLLALAIGALAWLDPAYKREHFATAIGERHDVTLTDSSQLLLGSGNQIEVSWHPFSHRVALRAGQVLFEVSPTRYRPFVVSAGSTDIRVLGTWFNVRRLDDGVRVALERGRVEVSTPATVQAPVVPLPDQQVDATDGQLMPLAKVDAATAMAWKDDRLASERMPLGEAVALLRHYRKAPILLDDPSLASLRLTGVFTTHNADRLLDLLPSILPMTVSRQENGSVEIQHKSTRKQFSDAGRVSRAPWRPSRKSQPA